MSNALISAPWLRAMARVFDDADAKLYIVGGAVRNPLMGLPLSDVDVCGPARPEAVCALCEGTEVRAHLRAAHFGTVELFVADAAGARHMAEYTTFREDSYRCGHRPDRVRFTTDIAVDALRRDFSINALYRRVREDGLEPVIDPTGGLAHMKNRVLHTVTPDPDRVLGDDGLRILRAARFQAELDLSPTSALLESLRRNAPLLADIACERLRDELAKTLMADLRYPMFNRRVHATASGLETLETVNAWPHLFGGLAYDAQAASALADLHADGLCALPLRMALLLRRAEPAALKAMMARLRFSVRETELAAQYLTALQALDTSVPDAFQAVKLGMDALAGAGRAFAALGDDAAAKRVGSLLSALSSAPRTLRELALNGDDLKPLFYAGGVPPARMGAVLNDLWRMAVTGEAPNTRDALLAAAVQLLQARSDD